MIRFDMRRVAREYGIETTDRSERPFDRRAVASEKRPGMDVELRFCGERFDIVVERKRRCGGVHRIAEG